ncbi:pyridoxamine 5'-phosphate oxidase family protein [uncultured Mucilaginibacter sp.]|uniref:pyridoxamine 5'-phosphate oxidase family protein n=1 Tax=uncultured Mucilaginibacter sp. TaxID=797541 RepID=UPI0025F91D17|nr:pyridoxamine 5'-phosphate oxidase family protein [uncultured Mucilaginibacter sp.]
MLGELNEAQIEDLLKKQITGRIGSTDGILPYIVPINYVYNGKAIISHSAPGKKIDMMRKNPRVCFQVDDIKSIFNWKSVVAWGRFEEITDMAEKEQAMMLLNKSIEPLIEKPADHPSHGIAEDEEDVGTRLELILYKIVLVAKTGRFEHH